MRFLIAASLLALAGCTPAERCHHLANEKNAGDTGLFSLFVPRGTVRIDPIGGADVELCLERELPPFSNVTVTGAAYGPLSVDSTTIGILSYRSKIHFNALSAHISGEPSGPFGVDLVATDAKGRTSRATVIVSVRGMAGALDSTFGDNGSVRFPAIASGEMRSVRSFAVDQAGTLVVLTKADLSPTERSITSTLLDASGEVYWEVPFDAHGRVLSVFLDSEAFLWAGQISVVASVRDVEEFEGPVALAASGVNYANPASTAALLDDVVGAESVDELIVGGNRDGRARFWDVRGPISEPSVDWKLVAMTRLAVPASTESRLLVAGTRPSGAPVFALVGHAGAEVAELPVGWGDAPPLDRILRLAVTNDAQAILLGERGNEQILERLRDLETIDSSFGNAGSAVVPLDRANAMVVTENSSILVTGEHDNRLCVVRFNPAGVWDRRFGAGGFACLGEETHSRGFSIFVDAFGRVLVGGEIETATGRDGVVARFWP